MHASSSALRPPGKLRSSTSVRSADRSSYRVGRCASPPTPEPSTPTTRLRGRRARPRPRPAWRSSARREPEAQDAADVRVDVGGRSDPSTGDFDHHQKGGAGERRQRHPLRELRPRLARLRRGARRERRGRGRDRRAPRPGRRRQRHGPDDRRVARRRRPTDDRQRRRRGHEPGVGRGAQSGRGGRALRGGRRARDPHPGARAPGAAAFAPRPAARPGGDRPRGRSAHHRARSQHAVARGGRDTAAGGAVRHVPEVRRVGHAGGAAQVGTFANRRDLPAAWAGLSGDGARVGQGVADAVFCHSARFYVSAASREGITELARRALESRGRRQPARGTARGCERCS